MMSTSLGPRVTMEAPVLATTRVEGALDATNLSPSDIDVIGELMWESYRGEIGGERREPDELRSEVQAFADGKYGPALWQCSFAAVDSGRPVSAVLVCEDQETPLLAYVFTHPKWRNRGLATALIGTTMNAAEHQGYNTLRLTVRTGNVAALHLYEKLGFRQL